MAITHDASVTVAHVDTVSVSTLTTGTFTSTAGQLCLVVGCVYAGGGVTWSVATPISDSKSNTWTLVGSENTGSVSTNERTRVYWAILNSAGSGHTISINSSANTEMILAAELFSGTATSSAVDVTSTSIEKTSTTTNFTANSVTTANAGDLVIGWYSNGNSRVGTSTAPQTLGSTFSGGGWFGIGISWDIKTVTGTYTPVFTMGVADIGWVGSCALLPASVAATANVSLPNLGAGLYQPVSAGAY